ncbi:bouquet formation protein Bqt1 [Schizosaccharomyces japonicus yFS275]|uniref:Bouquet formation protein Bqt1 n=1 Tax=Schizosaccharomyces japonicus (strain yFS275 / FY16936) TaxID=402676 RepID=B6K1X7_SCHJY|nr:bouquet formation protein Bqt1 [Schizosaccharomyces japonicus yFS275]EEB07158.1 bouquet formation protein Bqt1 [Schizosaccharomyces japonicus yFS275]
MHFLASHLLTFQQNDIYYLTQVALYTESPICNHGNCRDAQILKHRFLRIALQGIEELYATLPNIWQYAVLSSSNEAGKEVLIREEPIPQTNKTIQYCILPWERQLRGYKAMLLHKQKKRKLVKRLEKWRICINNH